MENMSTEILDSICDMYKEDEELVVTCLMYLYQTSNDDKLRYNIVEIMNDMNRCIECGDKLTYYEFQEYHPELGEYETCGLYDCARCGDWKGAMND